MTHSGKRTLETILVVDDNEEVLKVVVAILEEQNYRVLSATSAKAALKMAEMQETIHMLIADVDLPGMSGPDLGVAMKEYRPNLHVMQMSGGVGGNLLLLNYGWAYIQKSFVGSKLSHMVRDVLDTPDRSQPGGQEYDSRKDVNFSKATKGRVKTSGEEPIGTGKAKGKKATGKAKSK